MAKSREAHGLLQVVLPRLGARLQPLLLPHLLPKPGWPSMAP